MSIQRSQGKRAETVVDGRYYPLKCLQKYWYDCFFDHRGLMGKDVVPAVDTKVRLGGMEDNLDFFLQNSGNSCSPREAEKIKRYCKGGTGVEAIEQGIGEAGTRQAVWIDDRNSPHLAGEGNVRNCGTQLTATGLLRHLRHPVWHSS
jgi:hypothetical protein